jgi:hypothetical protein
MRVWPATVNTDLANPSPLCIVVALLDIVAELPYPRRCRRTALGLPVAREVFPREEVLRVLLILLVWRLEHHRAGNWALSHSTRYRMQLQECTCLVYRYFRSLPTMIKLVYPELQGIWGTRLGTPYQSILLLPFPPIHSTPFPRHGYVDGGRGMDRQPVPTRAQHSSNSLTPAGPRRRQPYSKMGTVARCVVLGCALSALENKRFLFCSLYSEPEPRPGSLGSAGLSRQAL